MRRRNLLTLLGGAAVSWPLGARAQGERMRFVALQFGGDAGQMEERVGTFRQALRDLGWEEGRNLRLVYRQGGGDSAATLASVKELVALQPDMLVLSGAAAYLAARQIATSIPIVFSNVTDPVERGFVASFAHPGGNATGVAGIPIATMAQKLVQILKQLVPQLRRVAILGNPDLPNFAPWLAAVEAAQASLGIEAVPAPIRRMEDFEAVLLPFAGAPDTGVAVAQDAFMNGAAAPLSAVAAKLRLPTISPFDTYIPAGGLVSYGIDLIDLNRRAAPYVDKILRGTKPADLPIEFPSKFALAINLGAAKALGLAVPQALVFQADKVTE